MVVGVAPHLHTSLRASVKILAPCLSVSSTWRNNKKVHLASWGLMGERGVSAQAVRRWQERKASHTESPLAIMRSGAPAPIRAAGVPAEARVAGRLLARTDRAQVVNQRVYFPLEDCDARMLVDSPKRWR